MMDDTQNPQKISTVVIVGNLLSNLENQLPMDDPDTEFTAHKKEILRGITKCNQLLNTLTSIMDVILVPSVSDFSDSF